MTSSDEEALNNVQQEIRATGSSTIKHVFQTTVARPADNIHIGPSYARSKQEELNDCLERGIATYKGRIFQAVTQFSQPDSPYKLLNSFRIEDASIFCGRTDAINDLSKKVFQSRLLILHAKSGAGKTSLLNAGLFPKVIRQGCLPLYIRVDDKDPVRVIKQTLISSTSGPWPDGLDDLSLHDFLAHVCLYLKRDNIKELIIAFDQFEDFYLYRAQLSERLSFIHALADCYSDQSLPVRIIISVRKDYFSNLNEFEEILPHIPIFQNYYRPSSMVPQEARDAIVQPLKVLHSVVTYDPALLDTLMTELSQDEIELPLLQIICTRLYETLAADKKKITLKMYRDLGKIEGVLKSYLNEVLTGFPEKEKVIAKDILKELINSDLKRQILSAKQLITRVESTESKLDHILARLVNARLLHCDDIEGEARYELVHDYLASEVARWIDSEDQEFKRAEELLRSEIANWRSYRHLISEERLKILYPYRERFKGLDVEDWECILRSVIAAEIDFGNEYVEYDVTSWVEVVSNSDANLLSKAIIEPLIADLQNMDNSGGVRSSVADRLAKIGRYGGFPVVESLIIALRDEDASVRRSAADALGKIGDNVAVESLIVALRDEDASVRRSAVGALGKIGDNVAVETLIVALRDEDAFVRGRATVALEGIGDKVVVEALIIALRDEGVSVRYSAAVALGKIGDKVAVEALIIALRDEDASVRYSAADALGEIGDNVAVEELIIALRDEDASVRYSAADALGEIGDKMAVEELIIALQDKDASVRGSAADALGEIGDKMAVEGLIIVLQDKDASVRGSAVDALGKIGDTRAIEILTVLLRDEEYNIRQKVAEALERINKTTI